MRQATPHYRIIFNWDGAPLDYDEHPQSSDRLMEQVYGPLEGTQVDAMFWSIGSHEAEWPSEVHERLGDGEGRGYSSMRAKRHSENVRSMFERGENPFQAMVDRGHELGMGVYVSMRMNDNHFYGTRPEEFKRLNRGTKFRQDHPDWLLDVDDVPEQRGIGSWNMAIPEVKEHKLSYIREACLQADWDGVELDWQRHPFHVPENYGYRLRYALTDLQRAVRRMADEIAEQRGRPFYVAARVATTLESCRNIGYDVERWAEEGLADIIIGAGGSGTDPGFEVGEFKALTRGTNIRLYGGFDSISRQQAERLMSNDEWRDAWLRAAATGYYDQGADGVYTFNWFPGKEPWRGLLTTLGSPETLSGRNKLYTTLHRGPSYLEGIAANAVNDRIYGQTAVVLYRSITQDGPTINVSVFDDVEAQSDDIDGIRLMIEFEHWAPDDRVEVSLDGAVLGEPEIQDAAALSGDPTDVSENKWLVWDLTPAQAAKGSHAVKVVLINRDSRIGVPLIVNTVDVHITYKG